MKGVYDRLMKQVDIVSTVHKNDTKDTRNYFSKQDIEAFNRGFRVLDIILNKRPEHITPVRRL